MLKVHFISNDIFYNCWVKYTLQMSYIYWFFYLLSYLFIHLLIYLFFPSNGVTLLVYVILLLILLRNWYIVLSLFLFDYIIFILFFVDVSKHLLRPPIYNQQ